MDRPAETVIPPRGRVPWPWRVAWGIVWRYTVLGAMLLYSETAAAPPWAALAAGLGAGVVLGLFHRRWALARLWRTAVVAATAVYVAPLLAVYPAVLTGSLGALTAAPFLATWHRRTR